MARVTLRFYEELNTFLPADRRKRSYSLDVLANPSVKDVIESQGVPHTEVDLVLVNGESVDFAHQVRDGDRISVYPVFEGLDISRASLVRPEPLRHTRFILDVHLGKLARLLRLFGFDTLYRDDYEDAEIVDIAEEERRIILTRDQGLLMRRRVTHGYWLRSQDPLTQAAEVLARFDLTEQTRPFSRCPRCNGVLEEVPAEEVADRVPPESRRHYDRFYQCRLCGQVYWQGSHYAGIVASLRDIRKHAEKLRKP